MHPIITTQDLYNAQKSTLDLHWVAGKAGAGLTISDNDRQESPCALIGNLNVLHPNQLQVLGRWEHDYLATLGKNSRADLIQQLFAHRPAALLIADGITADQE
jgi:HPr kinase/phosphorylase